MPIDPDLLTLARAVLVKNQPEKWDRAWDSGGTAPKKVSQAVQGLGTAKSEEIQSNNPSVPLSHALGTGTAGQHEKYGTALGTVVGQRYGNMLNALRSKCPELVDADRWQQAIVDAEIFLATWEEQAHALGWKASELFGLFPVPAGNPGPRFQRLSRYDATGLIWLLHGRPVIAITADQAAIQGHSSVTMYRKHRKPALGPLGDSLDDLGLGA